MELSKRLKSISTYIEKGAKVADIGTDHAYLPIYLVQEDIAEKVIAMDINKGPLEKAGDNIKRYVSQEKVSTRLSNGLDKLESSEADTVVVAGMGGMLVANILRGGQHCLGSMKRLVLQPQSDYAEVRKTIHELGFKIVDEEALMDMDKYYFIMVCEPGDERYETETEYEYGKILGHKSSEVYVQFLAHKKSKKEEVIKKLMAHDHQGIEKRQKELEEELNRINEVLTWQKEV